MSGRNHIEDEDLALYAMHSLAKQDHGLIEANLAHDPDLQQRLAVIRGLLSVYAETVELTPVPEGSFERLMQRLPQQTAGDARPGQVVPFVDKSIKASHPTRTGANFFTWAGWAVAASLAVTAGSLYRHQQRAHEPAAGSQPSPAQISSVSPELLQERNSLQAQVAQQHLQIEQLSAQAGKTQKEADTLRTALAGQAVRVRGAAAQVSKAQAEQEMLRSTVTAQANQVALLNNDAATTRQVSEALTDPTALRVTLTKPKSRPAPSARATYVANKGTLIFLASNLDQLKAGKTYELWFIPADGSMPVAAGTFAPDTKGNASIVYAQVFRSVAVKGFAVTLENEGGSGTPTLPILLAGSAGL